MAKKIRKAKEDLTIFDEKPTLMVISCLTLVTLQLQMLQKYLESHPQAFTEVRKFRRKIQGILDQLLVETS